MQNNNNVCRLCLKLVRSSHVAVLNEVMREMLRLLLMKMDLDISEHPLVCGTCSKVLDDIYLFKSKCLYNEDIVSARIETNLKVTLRDILIEMENRGNSHIGEDEVVCRLCIKIPLNGSYIALGETVDGISFIRDLIQIHLPEVDLSMSEKPIICEVCHVQLKNYTSFATNCMAVEEKIKLYCDITKISGPVDLSCVLQITEYKALDLQNSLDKDSVIKREDASVMVKVEKVHDAEDLISEDRLVDNSSASELCLKNEEIEIKSENDEMSEEMEDSVQTVAPNDSRNTGSLKRIRKSPTKGRECLSSDDHMTRHRGRDRFTFVCRDCTFATDREHILALHMVRHKAKSEVKMHKCENCEYMTRRKGDLNKHVMGKHRDRGAERKFKCNKCPYETDFKCYIRKHNLIHKDKSEVEMYKCENCEYETKRKVSLIQHMVKHLDPRPERKFKCDQCPFDTDLRSSLYRHKIRHTDISEVVMHKCAICEFEAIRRDSLNRHMLTHRDPRAERKFRCDQCSYETDLKSSLGMHNLIHRDKSEVEMHKCMNCEYETKRKRNLISHMMKHRDSKGERKFKCDKCPFGTDIKSYLRTHNVRRHKTNREVEMPNPAPSHAQTQE